MYILIINAGSSSVKYKLYNMDNESVLATGLVDRINMDGSYLRHEPAIGKKAIIKAQVPDYQVAIDMIMSALVNPEHGVILSIDQISAVGHRVVHGGEKISDSVFIDPEIERLIQEYYILAPLHNKPNMLGIQACKRILPDVPHVAVFDTAFHRNIPEEAYLYAIPYKYYRNHDIRRYGFHGTSHRYVSSKAAQFLGQRLEDLKMLTCHLGNGSSVAAVKNGKSIDTSMGFTPLEGLIMGTRSGDMDPALVLYLVEQIGMTVPEVNKMLNKESGLLGLSELSSDVRDLEEASSKGNKQALMALMCFAYRIKKYIGAYAAVMNGLDCVVFTAGIGENSSRIRAMSCKDLDFLGIKIDDKRNSISLGERMISTDDSMVKVLVIPTNEELLIARDTLDIIRRKEVQK